MKKFVIHTLALLSLVLSSLNLDAQIRKFNCDRWLAKPAIQEDYVTWLTTRSKSYNAMYWQQTVVEPNFYISEAFQFVKKLSACDRE